MVGWISKPGAVLIEAILVGVTGIILAFAANQVSPRGLVLGRNYFPTGTNNVVRAVAFDRIGATATTNSQPVSVEALIAAQMKQEGLQLLDREQAVALFHESEQDRGVVLVDARDESSYLEGHIPGAHEFDPYHPEQYFPDVLPLCQAARKILVYCNGGDCDDSQTAALLLRDVGISTNKLFVYGGGITDWTNHNLPLQTGSPKPETAGRPAK